MFDWRSPAEWRRLLRYYQAGAVNTAFGYGLFAMMIWGGFNLYAAQVFAYVLGTAFNYLTFSRYTFADQAADKTRFALSYAVNYLANLAVLWGFDQFIHSPYLAGFLTILVVSALNYVVLKRFVFRSEAG